MERLTRRPGRHRTGTLLVVVAALVLGGCSQSARTPHATGEWNEVLRDSNRSAAWTLYATTATDDGTCVSISFTPPIASKAIPAPDELYRDKPVSCAPRPRRSSAAARSVQIVDTSQAGDRLGYLVGAVASDVATVAVRFDDGEQSTLHPTSGFIVAVSLSPTRPTQLDLRLARGEAKTCTITFDRDIPATHC